MIQQEEISLKQFKTGVTFYVFSDIIYDNFPVLQNLNVDKIEYFFSTSQFLSKPCYKDSFENQIAPELLIRHGNEPIKFMPTRCFWISSEKEFVTTYIWNSNINNIEIINLNLDFKPMTSKLIKIDPELVPLMIENNSIVMINKNTANIELLNL